MAWLRSMILLVAFAVGLTSPTGYAQVDTEIFIIGVQHAPGQFYTDAFSPGYIRAVLTALQPDVIGVESAPEWFAAGNFYRATYEAQNIAMPWAQAHGIPVYGIDWIGDEWGSYYSEQVRVDTVRRERDVLAGGQPMQANYAYGIATRDQIDALPRAEVDSFLILNSQEFGQTALEWIDQERSIPGSAAEYMDARDGHITDHIVAVAQAHPGTRIVIVIGAQHKADLERRLAAQGFTIGVIEPVMGDFDLTDPAQMEDLLTAPDITAILSQAWDGANASSLDPTRVDRLLARLSELAATEEEQSWLRYLTARQAMIYGEPDPAAFEALIASTVRFPYQGYSWRQYLTVGQAAQLELGRLADLAGDRDVAVMHYDQFLSTLELPAYDEDYHSDYQFYAQAVNAVRALQVSPYIPVVSNVPVLADGITHDDTELMAEIEAILALNRSGKWSEALRRARVVIDMVDAPLTRRCEAYALATYAEWQLDHPESAHAYLDAAETAGCVEAGGWAPAELERVGDMVGD